MKYFINLGILGLGTFIGLIVDRLINIAKIQHDIKRDRFQLKVNEYAEWITKSKNISDIMSDTSFTKQGYKDIEKYVDEIRNSRNELKIISEKIILLAPSPSRVEFKNEMDIYFSIWKLILELNYNFRNYAKENNLEELKNIFNKMIAGEKKLREQNNKIIKLLYSDIDL